MNCTKPRFLPQRHRRQQGCLRDPGAEALGSEVQDASEDHRRRRVPARQPQVRDSSSNGHLGCFHRATESIAWPNVSGLLNSKQNIINRIIYHITIYFYMYMWNILTINSPFFSQQGDKETRRQGIYPLCILALSSYL